MMTKRRFALGLEYDGSEFNGFQIQENVPTVQLVLEKALSCFADENIRVFPSGRTDAGVHAQEQVVHFESSAIRDNHAWVFGGNRWLDSAVRILWVQEVPMDFDARRCAISRAYRYFIYNHPIRPSLHRRYVTWHRAPLKVEAMHDAAQYWLGEHDFSAFRTSRCQSPTTVRNMSLIKITRKSALITLDIQGNAFLHHMIRNMMGVLLEIGEKRKSPDWARRVLESRSRCQAGVTALPNGLYLRSVFYPEVFNLPNRGHEAEQLRVFL